MELEWINDQNMLYAETLEELVRFAFQMKAVAATDAVPINRQLKGSLGC